MAPVTTPLMSALAAKTLFSAAPTIEEEPETMDEDCEPADTASAEVQEQPHNEGAFQQEPVMAVVQGEGPMQPTVAEDDERSEEEGTTDEEANSQLPTALPSSSDDVTSMQSQTSEQQERARDVADRESTPPARNAPTEQLTEGSGNAAEEFAAKPTAAPGTPVAQQPDQVQQEFSFAAARRAFPRTPASAVRRSRLEADDAPTPIRNPLRIATPARLAYPTIPTASSLTPAFFQPQCSLAPRRQHVNKSEALYLPSSMHAVIHVHAHRGGATQTGTCTSASFSCRLVRDTSSMQIAAKCQMRVCPHRARPRVGHSEIRGLLQDPHAPSPAQTATLGSRNALSPMRARPAMRAGRGQAHVPFFFPSHPLSCGRDVVPRHLFNFFPPHPLSCGRDVVPR